MNRPETTKPCFGHPNLAGDFDCDHCHRYLRLACSLERECELLALDHVVDEYGGLRDQVGIERKVAAFRALIRERLHL